MGGWWGPGRKRRVGRRALSWPPPCPISAARRLSGRLTGAGGRRHTGAMAAGAGTVLVGRDRELERLEEQLRRAAAGQGGTVLVAGDAGIGKTRLVTELCARARAAGALPLLGRCIDLVGAEVPYLPVAEALRPLLAREEVRELLGSARELRSLLPGMVAGERRTGQPDGAPGSQLGLLGELLALLDIAAAAEPVVLVLEDLHWADRSTLDLVAFLAHNLGERRGRVVERFRGRRAEG